MSSLNFNTIRTHDGSQNNGFEELICQLAHLSPPKQADFFVRKEGAGGDGGIECFWKLKDGSEHAWQAKYHPNVLTSNQWSQITDSIKTALEKHPNLTKYFVCLPRDRNDSRKQGRNGKVTSSLDVWNAHVDIWKAMAAALNMSVEFEYWGKHEISLMLNRDTPVFAGRAIYWFGTPILTLQDFSELTHKSRASLGDRYTPEYHLDLPIAEVLESLGSNDYWEDLFKSKFKSLETKIDDKDILKNIQTILTTKQTQELQGKLHNLDLRLHEWIEEKTVLKNVDKAKKLLEDIKEELGIIVNELYDINQKTFSEIRSLRSSIYDLIGSTESLIHFLDNQATQAKLKNAILISGEAGIGKSHLLCDIALKRIGDGFPTIFSLGQHYAGGNPITSLKEQLDLGKVSNGEFLGALDAAGEANNSKCLIIIDAINEGRHREDWPNYLQSFLQDVLKYKHIGVVISCRTTFLEFLIPKDSKDAFVEVKHYGFEGHQNQAVSLYFDKHGISKPCTPNLSQEFLNPLFLKTFCKALHGKGLSALPKGMHGMTSLLDFYLEGVEETINKIKKYRKGETVSKRALKALALALYPNSLYGLPIDLTVDLINQIDTRPNQDPTLFDLLLSEGVISEDFMPSSPNNPDTIVIRFTYERFSDYFIADSLASDLQKESLKDVFDGTGNLAPIVGGAYREYVGILSAMSVIVAEKFEQELVDLLPAKFGQSNWLKQEIFTKPLLWRTGISFTERTREIFNNLENVGYFSKQLDTLLKLATEPLHPWNAEFLHQLLCTFEMPQRDHFWTTHVTVEDDGIEDEFGNSTIRSLIDWAFSTDLKNTEIERLRLGCIALIWMTTSSNREVRDQATKSVVNILTYAPNLLKPLLEKFENVDDLFLQERLYAISYGSVTNISDYDVIANVASWIWDKQFKNGRPTLHLLLREYAAGVMEYAYHLGALKKGIQPQNFRPPYKSDLPSGYPTRLELDELDKVENRIEIRNSILGFPGDFGNYTMGCIHQWSATPITEVSQKSGYTIQLEYADTLTKPMKAKFLKIINESRKGFSQPFDVKDLEKKLKARKSNAKDKRRLMIDAFRDLLPLDDRDYFNWVVEHPSSDKPARFSKKLAQKWVMFRALNLGWKEDLFGEFETEHIRNGSRSEAKVERIGKKYQWIALFEYLAYVADNFLYIDPGYSDANNSCYFGTWQVNKRDLDPTFLARTTGNHDWDKSETTFWWQPFSFTDVEPILSKQQEWLWDKKNTPPFDKLLQVQDNDGREWLVLHTFNSWRDSAEKSDEGASPDAWYRINSCIVNRTDLKEFKAAIQGESYLDPSVLKPNSTSHEGYIREYPWHPIYKDMLDWRSEIHYGTDKQMKCWVPAAEYEWEFGSRDHSITNSISLYMPSKELIKQLALSPQLGKQFDWISDDGSRIFFDPSYLESGPSAALCDATKLKEWLNKNNSLLIWLIGGEKGLYANNSSTSYGRLDIHGFYVLDKDGPIGMCRFEEEEPYH